MYQPITGTGNGSAPVVNLTWPFIEQDHVQARVNGAPVAATWTGASQITFSAAVPVGTPWDVVRVTPYSDPLVSFANGAVLTEDDLNLALTQLRYTFEEARQLGMGGDAALRNDLLLDTGAALIGLPSGDSVADATWLKGRTTAIAGSKAAIRRLRDNAQFPMEDIGAYWPGKIVVDHGINAVFDAGDEDAGNPGFGLLVQAVDNGSGGEPVALGGLGVVKLANGTVFGGNIVVGTDAIDGAKLFGLEIDVQAHVDATGLSPNGRGLSLVAFNHDYPFPALHIGGNGGTFANGIMFDGLSSTAAAISLGGAGLADSLMNSATGTITTAAFVAGQGPTRGIKWFTSGGVNRGGLYFNGTDQRAVLPLAGKFAFRKDDDSADLLTVDDTGKVGFATAMDSSSATAGAGVLPANPVGFLIVNIGGTDRKIPYYAT